MDKPTNNWVQELARKWAEGTISKEEMARLDQWFLSGNKGPQLWTGEDRDMESLNIKLRERLMHRVNKPNNAVYYIRYGVAAAVLLLMIGVGYQLAKNERETTLAGNVASVDHIVPGKDKAYLTLSDGKTIELAADQATLVVRGTQLRYADGALVGAELDEHSTTWNTISVPNGGKYKIQLPDHSLVWLNAGSSLRFPSSFDADGREVELMGEAYFDVVKQTDGKHRRVPFVVNTKHQAVEVLGTQFNVNAYDDEPTTRTTLLEGSIRVHVDMQEYTVRPLEEAVLQNNGSSQLHITVADTLEAVAWKNDLFRFKGLDIHGVLKQVARWYDVEVRIDEPVRHQRLTGYVSRNLPINRVLAMLEEVGNVSFEIQGRTIYVKSEN